MAFEKISSGKWQNYSKLSLVRLGGSSGSRNSASSSSSSPALWRGFSVLCLWGEHHLPTPWLTFYILPWVLESTKPRSSLFPAGVAGEPV